MIFKANETNLWHRKLGYLNLRSMRKITFEKAIISFPNIKTEEGESFGECQIGKHIKMSQKEV